MPRVSQLLLIAVFLLFVPPSLQSQDLIHKTAASHATYASSFQGETPAPQQQNPDVNRRIRDSIRDLLSSDPVLSGASVEATVDDKHHAQRDREKPRATPASFATCGSVPPLAQHRGSDQIGLSKLSATVAVAIEPPLQVA
ncbi:MAG TPA: hypothetical protein VKV30_09305 [Candidatus Angelobacter sp.]|nr:hypothetical protein [Candidatus Angelobacter sp.]